MEDRRDPCSTEVFLGTQSRILSKFSWDEDKNISMVLDSSPGLIWCLALPGSPVPTPVSAFQSFPPGLCCAVCAQPLENPYLPVFSWLTGTSRGAFPDLLNQTKPSNHQHSWHYATLFHSPHYSCSLCLLGFYFISVSVWFCSSLSP